MHRSFSGFAPYIVLALAALFSGCASVPDGRTLDADRLNNAIVADEVSYVRALVQARTLSVDQVIPAPGYMEGTPLITIAAKSAALDVLQFLIRSGANVNARTPAAETAVMLAAYFAGDGPSGRPESDYLRALAMLADAGASVENDSHHYTPLAYAAYQGHDRILRFLLERGARVNGDAEDNTVYVNSALMMAAIQGHERTAMLLLKAGADARLRVKDGMTAAELARKNNHQRLANMLTCAERHAGGAMPMQSC